MEDARLRQRIKEIAGSMKNLRDEELFALMDNHVRPFCQVRGLRYDHRSRGGSHHVFTAGSRTFTIAKPHRTSLLKPVYVRLFLDAMEELDLYDGG